MSLETKIQKLKGTIHADALQNITTNVRSLLGIAILVFISILFSPPLIDEYGISNYIITVFCAIVAYIGLYIGWCYLEVIAHKLK